MGYVFIGSGGKVVVVIVVSTLGRHYLQHERHHYKDRCVIRKNLEFLGA